MAFLPTLKTLLAIHAVIKVSISDMEFFILLPRARICNLPASAKFMRFPRPIWHDILCYKSRSEENLPDISFHTVILTNSTYPSTIWDKSPASYAHEVFRFLTSLQSLVPHARGSTHFFCSAHPLCIRVEIPWPQDHGKRKVFLQ